MIFSFPIFLSIITNNELNMLLINGNYLHNLRKVKYVLKGYFLINIYNKLKKKRKIEDYNEQSK